MSFRNLLELVANTLRDAGVPYMLTGSLAGSYHGAPRSTQDIDLVVDAPIAALLSVATRLRGAGLYLSDDAIREAHSSRGMFNAIDPESGWKIDFIIRKDRPFSRAEFESRCEIEFLGLDLSITSAEDLIIAKLDWARLGNSERQIRDVAQIIAIQGSRLDVGRIEKWVADLDLGTEWGRARDLSDPAAPS